MAKTEQKLKAQALRARGLSVRDIAIRLCAPKSSVSLWCKDIVLSRAQRDLLVRKAIKAGHIGRLLGAQRNREKKLMAISRYKKEGILLAKALSPKESLLIGAAIYWSEGSKVGQLSFINSDKDMILFMYRWFQTSLGVERYRFNPRIFINASHRSRKEVIERFWSKVLDLPPSQFGNTVFINRNSTKKYANHDEYYGLLALRIRNSTDLKYKILGLIDGLKCSTF